MKKIVVKAVSTLLALIVCASVPLSAFADAKEDRHNEGQQIVTDDVDFWNTINIDQSFAYQVRMATNAADRQYSVGNPIGGMNGRGYGDQLRLSNIAPFWAYSAGEVEDQISSPENVRTANSDTPSTRMYSRAMLKSAAEGNQSGSDQTASFSYYTYGLLLSTIGFDSVGTSANDVTRSVYGWAAQTAYMAASSVNMIFESCFNFLCATNPFLFFKDINASGAAKNVLQSINASALDEIGGNTDSVNALTAYFGKIFNLFTDFAWTVSIPLSLLFIIVSFFLTRRGRYMIGGNIKKFFIRVVFVAIGVPILGSAYTQVLDGLRHTQSTSDEFLSQAVSKTFFDFGAWVETSRLSPYSDMDLCAIISDNNTLAKASTLLRMREICSSINNENGISATAGNGGLSVSKTGVLLKDYIYDSTSGTLSIDSASTNKASGFNTRQTISDMLNAYKNGTKYTATMFESGAVAWMQAFTTGSTSYGDMLALSVDKYSFSPAATRLIHGLQGKVDDGAIQYDPDDTGSAGTYGDVAMQRFVQLNGFAGVNYNIWNNGTLVSLPYTANGDTTQSNREQIGRAFSGQLPMGSKYVLGDGYDCSKSGGFSTMSMYTYLTSEFTPEGIMVYGNSPSVYTHKFHYSVNLIGSNGIMQFAFLANTLAILMGYFFLAVAFVFRTVFDILFKGFQIMGHALLAAAGFYKSIGTCVCMVVNMIAQLFVTVVFFSFMVDFMFMLSSIFDNLFFEVFDIVTGAGTSILNESAWRASSSYGAEVMVTLASLVSSFVIVFFVSFAAKWRALIMNSINSMVENIIGTCLGVNLNGASDGALSGMMKSAFNDAKTVATGAAVVGGGTALAAGAQDMLHDLVSDKDAEDEETAVDAAVNPKQGAGLGSNKNENENDLQRQQEGKDLLDGTESLQGSDDSSNAMIGTAKGLFDKAMASDSIDPNWAPAAAAMTTATSALNGDAKSKQSLSSETNTSNTIEDSMKELANKALSPDSIDSDLTPAMTAMTATAATVFGKGAEMTANTVSDESSAVVQSNSNMAHKSIGSYTYGGTAAQQAAQRALDENTSALSDGDVLARDGVGGLKYDPKRGLVLSSANDDGTASDIGIGLNGVSMSSTDKSGTTTMQSFSKSGDISVARTGSDGSSERVSTSLLNGSSAQKVRTLDDGSVETVEITTEGQKVVTVDNMTANSHVVKTINADGSYSVISNVGGKETSYSGFERGANRGLNIGDIALGESVDATTGVVSQSFEKGSNTYDVTLAQTGSTVIRTVQNGAEHTFINNEDGSAAYTTVMDGYERRETIVVNSDGNMDSKIVYRDSGGKTVNDSDIKAKLDAQYAASWTNVENDVGSAYSKYRDEISSIDMHDFGGSVLKRSNGDHWSGEQK